MRVLRIAIVGGWAVVAWTGAGWIGAAPALAQTATVSVQNVGPATVVSIQVSPDYKRFWSGNRLNQALPPGGETTLDISGYGEDCWFDFLVTDEAGEPHQISGINVCEGGRVAVP